MARNNQGTQSGNNNSGNSSSNNRGRASDDQMAGDGGQTLEQARENGRKGAEIARQMRERGELPPDNGAGTMKGVPGAQGKAQASNNQGGGNRKSR